MNVSTLSGHFKIQRMMLTATKNNTMDEKKHLSGAQKRKRKKTRDEDVKRMKVSLTNWVLTNQNKQNIGDCSDRQGQTEHANCYGLSADTSSETGQQISNKQATICRDETVGLRKDSIQVSGSTSNDDLGETGLQVSESKAATFHIDGANKQATVGESEAGLSASTPSVTDDSVEQPSKTDNVNVDVLLDHDPSNWPCPDKVTDSFRMMLTENGPPKFPDGPFPRSQDSNRCFSKAYCYRRLTNCERVERDWLMFSHKTNKVYCFACKVFGGEKTHNSRFVKGYGNWRCLSSRLKQHETGPNHTDTYLAWKELETRLRLGKCIDNQLQVAMEEERTRWKQVLTRVLDCI